MHRKWGCTAMVLPMILSAHATNASAAPVVLSSPDGRIRTEIGTAAGSTPGWSATFRGNPLLSGCGLGLQSTGDGELTVGARLISAKEREVDRRIRVLFGKCDYARDRFHEVRLALKGAHGRRIDIVFRCYDDAIAFRYEIPRQKGLSRLTITDETTSFGLAGNPTAYVEYLENYRTSHEHNVTTSEYVSLTPDTLIDMPATFEWPNGVCAAITEAALRRYAGMSLMRPKDSRIAGLVCKLTPRDDGTKVIGDLPMETPWRVVLVGDRHGALLESNTIYCLNAPSAIGDSSWIHPGKMTWPWWNGHLYGPTHQEPILSMAVVRKYVDFCAASGIRYHSVVSDEADAPWYVQKVKGLVPGPGTDATKVRPDLDLEAIRQYAESKGIGLWTWVHQGALRGRVEEAFAAYEKMGWGGMMIDFFDHDDQDTVEFAESILRAAARHHILIHFHGIWKPTGWQRTYPNLMNHEGALNLEYLKWSDRCTPEHDLMLAFTRLVAGPMDYHLGGFRAVKRADFIPHFQAPNVLGTRCHQLAMYVCWDNPNPMVADYPEAYRDQPGFDFLQIVPTWWDETRVLDDKAGELLVTARRRGKTWYIGGIGAQRAQDVNIPLGFIGRGARTARLWTDSPASVRDPNLQATESINVTSDDTLHIHLEQDGGFVAQIAPAERRTPSSPRIPGDRGK